MLLNTHRAARSRGESLALRNRRCPSLVEAEMCSSNIRVSSKKYSRRWAVLTCCSTISPVVMWCRYIRHLALDVQIMSCFRSKLGKIPGCWVCWGCRTHRIHRKEKQLLPAVGTVIIPQLPFIECFLRARCHTQQLAVRA